MDQNTSVTAAQKQVQAQQIQTQQTQTALQQTQQQQPNELLQNENQVMLAELTQEERQAAEQNQAAPAPAIQEQRRRKTLKEKLAERKQRKAEEKRQKEERKRQERAEREERAQREAEEQRQREEEEQREQEEQERAARWREEQSRLMDDMDASIEHQGTVKEARLKPVLGDYTETILQELEEEEIRALTAYTKEAREPGEITYRSMNRILRNTTYQKGGGLEGEGYSVEESKENYKMVEKTIEALSKTKLPQDVVVRRGTNLSALLRFLNLEVSPDNDTMKDYQTLAEQYRRFNDGNFVGFDRGFLSTSPYRNGGFFTGGIHADIGVEFVIQAHEGDEALFLQNISNSANEAELLFQAGTQLRIIKICPPAERKLLKGQLGSFKVYLETVKDVKPLRGENEGIRG